MVTAAAHRGAGVAVGLLLDGAIREPPDRLHPVAHFGGAMTRVESHLWADRRAAGAAYAGLGVLGAWTAGRTLERCLGRGVSTAAAVLVAAAGRGLSEAAVTVAAHLRSGDLPAARDAARALVGRDVHDLDEKEICRAVVESVAENLSDAVVASALWGLVAGAPGCLIHRAANTLDAMVGHRNPRYRSFGWASARLDDLLGWPAARATAVLVALACPQRAGAVGRVWRTQASAHPSPNAGVAEAAFAAALDLRLGGTNRYGGRIEERPPLGHGAAPGVDDIDRAVRLLQRVTRLVVALSGSVAVAAAVRRPRAHAPVVAGTGR